MAEEIMNQGQQADTEALNENVSGQAKEIIGAALEETQNSGTSPIFGASKVTDNFKGLPMRELIAAPLIAAAEAQHAKALKGAREQEITGAYELWQKAKAGLEIAEKSYNRVRNLYEKGVMSAQKKDEAEANYNAMVATEKAARSQYEMAKEGARKEDKAAAAALVNQASGAVAEVESYVEEEALTSPIDGEIIERFPEVGELVGTGSPILNIADMNDMWVTFSIREDLLAQIRIGNEIHAFVPALGNQDIVLKVYYMKDMGTYAAWKATKSTGQYDAKTFEVRARPLQPIEGLRPGMSVIWKPAK